MDDDRVWSFEESLWRASADRYHERVDPECIMALNHAPMSSPARPPAMPSAAPPTGTR